MSQETLSLTVDLVFAATAIAFVGLGLFRRVGRRRAAV